MPSTRAACLLLLAHRAAAQCTGTCFNNDPDTGWTISYYCTSYSVYCGDCILCGGSTPDADGFCHPNNPPSGDSCGGTASDSPPPSPPPPSPSPPPYLPPLLPPTQPTGYVRVTSGKCEDQGYTPIADAAQCFAGGTSVGLTDTDSTVSVTSNFDRPCGCTFHPISGGGVTGNLELWTSPCSVTHQCDFDTYEGCICSYFLRWARWQVPPLRVAVEE